jgi:glutathione reductase (NADPH)
MKAKLFDFLVLGGGSGGIASAIRAARHGAKVALIEKAYLGGTCVNHGCVPKKLMYNAAALAKNIIKSKYYGFSELQPQLDWTTIVQKRNHYIHQLQQSYEKKLKDYQVTIVKGFGRFINKQSIAVDNIEYKAKHVLIATGGKPASIQIPGAEYSIDSDGFFTLNKQPKKVAIIGGGYIGVELSGILNALDTETHLFIRGEQPLHRFDADIGKHLMKLMTAEGISIYPKHVVTEIKQQANTKRTVICKENSQLSDFDLVISAVGRQARTKNINIEATAVHCDEKGLISVDAYQNTSIHGIYAIGDVTNAPALTPVAIEAGRKLADRLFSNQSLAHVDYENIPTVVFSHPPIGTVGMSEKQAKAIYGEEHIKCYTIKFNPMFDALSPKKTKSLMKLITYGENEKIIGLHIVDYHADEILQGFSVAIKMGACKKDFDATMAIHPTSAEELVTMA